MKSLFAFLLMLTFAFAFYTPVWNQCGQQTDDWTPNNVIVQSVQNNFTLIAACGVVSASQGSSTKFKSLSTNGTDGPDIWTNWELYQYEVATGSTFCLNITMSFPYPGDVPIRFNVTNDDGNEAGCVDVLLKYSGSKFLFKREET